MPSSLDIAKASPLRPINEIGKKLGLGEEDLEPWGNAKAKISLDVLKKNPPKGKLILVTTINPTPAGEGKTTTVIGLAQGMAKIGKNVTLGIREPSIGPCMGMKGGAAGGGYSQVLPMEDINLHFTGDIHAVSAAHNLMAAMLDNHIHYDNTLDVNQRRILWHRVVDMDDRALRKVVLGLGGEKHGIPREDSFSITAASEVMAILCLSQSIEELKERLGRMIIAQSRKGELVTASDLNAVGAMAVLLKHAIKPNLVQTVEGVPAFVHGGPFANIAHGASSLISTKMGLGLADYFITEAGFGSDLGAEKFFNIVCRTGEIKPDGVVMVVTCRSLKWHGGCPKDKLLEKNVPVLMKGFPNLAKHLANIQLFGVPSVVAINVREGDHEEEIETIRSMCEAIGVPVAVSDIYAKGGEGGIALAHEVVKVCDSNSSFKHLYDLDLPSKEKIDIIVRSIYGASRVVYSVKSDKAIERIEKLGLDDLAVCVAKNPYSFSEDPKKLGQPKKFKMHISEIRVSAGAGFIIPITGTISTMPGLPKSPAADRMDIDNEGRITGLF